MSFTLAGLMRINPSRELQCHVRDTWTLAVGRPRGAVTGTCKNRFASRQGRRKARRKDEGGRRKEQKELISFALCFSFILHPSAFILAFHPVLFNFPVCLAQRSTRPKTHNPEGIKTTPINASTINSNVTAESRAPARCSCVESGFP